MNTATRLICAAALLLTAACGPSSNSEGSPPPSQESSHSSSSSTTADEATPAPVATKITNLAPVLPQSTTHAGEDGGSTGLAPGWTYGAEPDLVNGIDCDSPSPGAVSDNIMSCSPVSADAVACWPASQGTVICLKDIWKRTLKQVTNLGSGAKVKAPKDPSPLGLTLDNGDHCVLRTGGSDPSRSDRSLVIRYYCSNAGGPPDSYQVWSSQADGINKSSPTWTVTTGTYKNEPLVTRAVTEAYFVSN